MKPCENRQCAKVRRKKASLPQWRMGLCEACRRREVMKIMAQSGTGPRVEVA